MLITNKLVFYEDSIIHIYFRENYSHLTILKIRQFQFYDLMILFLVIIIFILNTQ